MFQRATGKSPEPAGWKACPTWLSCISWLPLCVAALIFIFGLHAGAADPPPTSLKELPTEARKIMSSAEKFVLFSLDPDPSTGRARGETFHDYQVLGKTTIADPRQKLAMVNSLANGMAHADKIAKCFNPRHGIRASRGTNSVDLIICFECGQVYGFSNTGSNWVAATTIEPEKLFNDVLKKSGVPLPEPPSRNNSNPYQ